MSEVVDLHRCAMNDMFFSVEWEEGDTAKQKQLLLVPRDPDPGLYKYIIVQFRIYVLKLMNE